MYNSHPPTKIIFSACMQSRKTEFHGGPPGQHEALKSRCEQTVSQRFSMQVLSRVAALGQALRVRSARAAYRGLQNCLLRIGDDDDHCCCCCHRCCCCFSFFFLFYCYSSCCCCLHYYYSCSSCCCCYNDHDGGDDDYVLIIITTTVQLRRASGPRS